MEMMEISDLIQTKTQSEADIKCDVCLWDDDCENDEICICEMCQVAVHQTCYGSEIYENLPKDDWFCHRCTAIMQGELTEPPKCELCPRYEGAMKKTNIGWVHL
jgi:NuA3 HAT complex component NTO1